VNKKAAIVWILGLILTGCTGSTLTGSGVVNEQLFDLKGFESIDVCCGMDLFIETGSPETVRIVAEDNILAAMEVRTRGNALVVDFGTSIGILDIEENYPMQIFVTLPELTGVEVSGGGGVSVAGVSTNQFSLNLSGGSGAYLQGLIAADVIIESTGGGDLDLRELQVGQLTISKSGGGGLALYGLTEELEADLSGGSELNARYLQTTSADVRISGGGRSSLAVTDELRVDLSGGSRLDYYGNPEIRREQTSGDSELVGHATP